MSLKSHVYFIYNVTIMTFKDFDRLRLFFTQLLLV